VLVSSAKPSAFGQALTFTATISITAPGAGTPSGTVQFRIDGSNFGSAAGVSTAGGVTTASLSTTSLAVGSHTVTASYSGDGSFASSSGMFAVARPLTKPAPARCWSPRPTRRHSDRR